MSFTKTLLAGAAIGALCTAPALARTAPNIHLAGIASKAKMTTKGSHSKTDVANPNYINITQTVSFFNSLSFAADTEVPVLLFGETWQDTASCVPPTRESATYPRRTHAALISTGTSTGPTSACPNSIFTFYGPMYDLRARNATGDSFSGSVDAKRYSGYNLTLNGNTILTITP